MDRRHFLTLLGLMSAGSMHPLRVWSAPQPVSGAEPGSPNAGRLLILIALKGGNDGLNTLIPYRDPHYRALRPDLAIPADQIIQLSEQEGLHPALQPLHPCWQAGELALIRGVGYPQPNLSHFRSMDIWETASKSDQALTTGWLTRCFEATPPSDDWIADGIATGQDEIGPLRGSARILTLSNLQQFQRQAQRLGPLQPAPDDDSALRHVVQIENQIRHASAQLRRQPPLQTSFPESAFGRDIRTACQIIANRQTAPTGVIQLSLNGFDTHVGQQAPHARCLDQLATGLASLRAALIELDAWNQSLILTYSEFGRRPQQNANQGTDHGTANLQMLLGGRIKGGLYGKPLQLDRLDGRGNPDISVDFRSLYATVMEHWWQVDSLPALGDRFPTLPLISPT